MKNLRARKLSGLVPCAPAALLWCHSEEVATGESVFGARVKQMLHSVQHDTTANSVRWEDLFVLWPLRFFDFA
jgi:hypothetical protein